MTKLYIVRGLPGSGKSTWCNNNLKSLTDFHIEADQYFQRYENSEYEFDAKFLSEAHDWCYANTVYWLREGFNVYVSNTFTKIWEMERYLAIPTKLPDVQVEIVEIKTQFKSVHGVPEEKMKQMAARWEEIPEEWNIKVTKVI